MFKREILGEVRKVINKAEIMLQTIGSKRVAPNFEGKNKLELGPKVGNLKGKNIIISGASRGIGLAIAKRCAKDGANIIVAAKTKEPHPKLDGTIYTAAEEIEEAGGQALPLVVDVRESELVEKAVAEAVEKFGGIDIVINNASAIYLSNVENTTVKQYDLMFDINVRGSFLLTKACIPYLMKADNPHVLTLAPKPNLDPKWFKHHGVYTSSKYAMAMMAQTFSSELETFGIASNALWPRTLISTAAIWNMQGGKLLAKSGRKPEIMADAAYEVFTRKSSDITGHFLIDDEVLYSTGMEDFENYSITPGSKLHQDLFL